MAHDGRAIANFVLDRCDRLGRTQTNLSLQKVVYFCHVWTLVKFEEPLVKHQFEAWQYGPVLPYLYRDFKAFDSSPITSRATRLDPVSGDSGVVSYLLDEEVEENLNLVVDFYSRLKSGTLVAFSHVAGGPWDEVWNHDGVVNPGMKISDERIAEYYRSRTPPF